MVLTVGAAAPSARAPARASGPQPSARCSLRDVVQLRPGWPVVLLFVGYPLWWALGITDLVSDIAAIAMATALVKRPHLRVPHRFGVVLLFLTWIALSFLLIQIAAPVAVTVADSNRYLTASWRLLWYVKAVVLLLYLGNEREHLRQAWICRTLGWMFVYVTAGGLLGVLAPSFQFRSLAERVLPHGLASAPFVHANIHPVAAERYADFLGGAYRTSAPFAYANTWGLNLACFLPFFVAGWLSRDAGRRRRIVGWLVLGGSVVPIVLSLNRGLWLALAAAAVLLAVRAAIGGQLRVIAILVGGALIIGTVLAASPLGASIEHRLSGNGLTSAHTRSHLVSVTVSSVRDESPLLGFGATRNVQGNFTSIAGGATSTCRRCSPPALGTQGQLLLVTFTQGLVGAVLYFGFLLVQFVRYLTTASKYVTAGLAVLVVHFVTSVVYSADNLAILPIFAAVALLWRAGAAHRMRDNSGKQFAPDEPELAAYATALRRHWRPVVAVIAAGLLVGLGFASRAGPVYRATESIYVADALYPDPTLAPLPTSLDAVARNALSSSALMAMRRAAGPHVRVEANRLSVTATANSKILHLTYAGSDPRSARALASAAAAATLRLHALDLRAKQQQVIATLRARLDALDTAAADVTTAAEHAGQPLAVQPELVDLWTQLRGTGVQLAAVQRLPLEPGRSLGPASVAVSRDRQLLDAANGLGFGVLVAAGLLSLRGLRRPRVAAQSGRVADVPLVWRGRLAALDARELVLRYRPGLAVAAGADRPALRAAADLDAAIPVADRGTRGVIVTVGEAQRVGELRRTLSWLRDARVIGVVAVAADPRAEVVA